MYIYVDLFMTRQLAQLLQQRFPGGALARSCSGKGSASLGQSMYTACVHMSLLYLHICM